jgi:hypothetical protein
MPDLGCHKAEMPAVISRDFAVASPDFVAAERRAARVRA